MSSARKRAATQKANAEADHLRQKLMLAEHHGSVMKLMAEELARRCDAQQAEIDRLMLEFCPDEMTDEQRERWAHHQRPVTPTYGPENPPRLRKPGESLEEYRTAMGWGNKTPNELNHRTAAKAD